MLRRGLDRVRTIWKTRDGAIWAVSASGDTGCKMVRLHPQGPTRLGSITITLSQDPRPA